MTTKFCLFSEKLGFGLTLRQFVNILPMRMDIDYFGISSFRAEIQNSQEYHAMLEKVSCTWSNLDDHCDPKIHTAFFRLVNHKNNR